MKLEMTLPIPTSLNKLYVNQYGWNPATKTRSPTGARILSKEGEACKKELQKIAEKAIQDNGEWDYEHTIDNHIFMDYTIYFHRAGCDENNVLKLMCDSLEKICYENDSRVLTRCQRIYIDKFNPRVEVELKEVDYIGIFDTEAQFVKFVEKCKTCSRHKNNCSLLNGALEYRIQEEIILEDEAYICSKYKQKKE